MLLNFISNFHFAFFYLLVTARCKQYSSLLKGRFGIRNRLQVNVPTFEDEKIGDKDKYFSRLATEWDEYYIHELRYRRPARKFCVKS